MIRYRIYEKKIEVEWDTGAEYCAISKLLEVLDVMNMVRDNRGKE